MINTYFDFRSDSGGKDPDKYSQTLKEYHQLLWSKQLPNGDALLLDTSLRSSVGNCVCEYASDSIIHTYTKWDSLKEIVNAIDDKEIEEFIKLSYTIGGFVIFPKNKVNGKMTINGARGLNRKINDRIDLTLECIRRYYLGEESPLTECLNRYSEFFELFNDFKGYVDFFLLQDLVDEEYKTVRFLLPFDGFQTKNLPVSVEEYIKYKDNTIAFVKKRNKRISDWCQNARKKGELILCENFLP